MAWPSGLVPHLARTLKSEGRSASAGSWAIMQEPSGEAAGPGSQVQEPLDLNGISACRGNSLPSPPPRNETAAPRPAWCACVHACVHGHICLRADTPEPLQAAGEDDGHARRRGGRSKCVRTRPVFCKPDVVDSVLNAVSAQRTAHDRCGEIPGNAGTTQVPSRPSSGALCFICGAELATILCTFFCSKDGTLLKQLNITQRQDSTVTSIWPNFFFLMAQLFRQFYM